MKKSIALLAVIAMCFNLQAGNLKPVAQKISDQKTKLNSVGNTELFALTNSSNQRSAQLNAVVSNATVLEFNQSGTQHILNTKPENLNFIIPTKTGGTIELELFKSNFFTPDFSVVTSATNGQPVPYEGGVHYWGIIKGDNSSLAAISIFNDEVMGMISSPALGNLVLGKIENDATGRHILYNDKDLHATDVPHCATADEPGGYSKDMLREGGNQIQSVNCIRLYWEVNYDIYTGKGSVTAATNYVTAVFNQSAIIYTNDNIPVSLSQVFVWNTASPYTGTTTSDLLTEFQTNVNSFNGDLASLLGYAGGGGIAASTSGLCNSNTDYKQCYSGISSSYQNVPTYSWTVEVITHEQGHLMGSRHTHDCAWNGNNTKIDSCGDYAGYASGTCSVGGGNQALPSGGGTIMSYCHLIGAVGINFSNGFGSQPKTVILNKYNAASCLTACVAGSCNAATGMTTGTIGQTSAVFSWTAVTGAVSYNVQYRVTGTTGWTTGNTTSTSFTASSLTAGATYEWQVQTVCSTGSSSFTASTTFTTLPAMCNTPTGLSTTSITTSSAIANWAAVAGATSYSVRYRKTGTTAWTTNTVTATTFSITGLTSSTTYEWQVRTVCSFGNSSYSSSVTFTTLAVVTCNAPTGMSTGSITQTSALFSWTAASGAVTYNVQYRKTGTTAWTTGSTSSTSFTASALTPGTTYEWQVQTVCAAGSSSFTNSTTFTTSAITSCGAPTGLSTTSITSSSATLNWNATLCDSFLLRYIVTSIPNTVYFKIVTPGTATSTTISGLWSSTNYTWLIRTYCNGAQSGTYSSTTTFTTLASNCGIASGMSSSSVNSNSAILAWAAVPGAATYNVQYRITGTTAWSSKSTASTSVTVTGLTGASIYEWQVQTVCSFGTSPFSGSATFTTLAVCNAPTGLSTTNITSSSATLNWNAVACDSFLLRYIVTSIPNTVYFKKVSPGTATSTTIGGLLANTNYTWLVRTYCNNGQSGIYSATASFTTLTVSPQPEHVDGTTEMINSSIVLQQMILYPNPAQDNLTVEFSANENGSVKLNVCDLIGQKIIFRKEEVHEGINVVNINTSEMSKGVYLFEMESNGTIQRQKFLISR